MAPTSDTLCSPPRTPAAEPAPPRLPRGLRLRITVAIPLMVLLLVVLSGFLALWVGHPLFLASGRATSIAEVEQQVLLAVLTVVGFAVVATAAATRLAGSIARPLRELTSRVESLRPPSVAEPAPTDSSEIAALGSALEGVVSSVSSLILDSYTLRSLEGADYIHNIGLDLSELSEPAVVFEGSAREAVKLFPQNVNVAAAISLAGIGFDRTRVKVIADPKATRNHHTLTVSGRFGTFEMALKNYPSISNPKTSYLAGLSGIATLRNIVSGIWIGT